MTAAEIRRSFLQFFADRGHTLVASSPLVPANDPTLLLTNAGMIQFKDVFLGKEQRPYRRAASAQKCMRVSGKHNDLDNVGPSLRHHTFFEMLGNFSFGDYFKADAIPFAWTLLTDGWNLPAERLFPTVFGGGEAVPRDDEARRVWAELVPADRIVELGLADNFWAMGDTGPCGRCSEIHYHRGDHHPCPEPVCRGVACSCDRFVEIWNNVFMEFERREDGSLVALPAPSIDTGMGLERIVAVLQDTLSNYDTDLFTPLLAEIGALTGTTYQAQTAEDAGAGAAVSMRVVADHVRAMTFLIADGVRPSNEWRGYVLRKIMRRAMRHGKKLGLTEPFLGRVVDVVVRTMGSTYPELDTHRNAIVAVVQREEEQFDKVLGEGLPRLESVLAQAREAGGAVPGAEAFRLHDTYGLPLDFVEDLAGERGLRLDRAGFDRAMAQQRAHSRQNTGGLGQTRDGDGSWVYRSRNDQQTIQRAGDHFEGYKSVSIDGIPILALFDEGRCQVAELAEGARGYAVLERTPFYVEAGGQVSDTGQLVGASGRARVEAMERLDGSGSRAHAIHMEAGSLSEGKPVRAEVDGAARAATRRNHTATHLLHAALRALLGTHVAQAGSLVAPDRLRFDFSHFDPLTTDQRTDIELWVTRAVYADHPVQTAVRATADAMADGAMALFGEKYGERVRVVSIPNVSMELCGGTHCRATGEIGPFVITHETGVAAGVRRVEALTGDAAAEWLDARRKTLETMLDALAVPAERAVETLQQLQRETRRLARELEQRKVAAALDTAGADKAAVPSVVAGVPVITQRVRDLEKAALRSLADSLRDRLGSGVVLLAAENGGKVSLLVSVTRDLTARVHAGNLVKALAPIVGGRGGGGAHFAEAGGKWPGKIDDAFTAGRTVMSRMLEDRAEDGR